MPSNLKVLLSSIVVLHCKSQRLAASCGEFSNACYTRVQIRLWLLKIWAGKSQKVVFKNKTRELYEALVDILQQSLLRSTGKLIILSE